MELTERGALATFYGRRLTAEQVEANRRIPPHGRLAFFEAAASPTQHLAASFADGRLAGLMTATRHGRTTSSSTGS